VKIQVKVKPNSKQQSITEEADGSLTIKLKSSPVEGKESGDGYINPAIKEIAESAGDFLEWRYE
jgi:hypothetical protein